MDFRNSVRAGEGEKGVPAK
ncbi:uncharacterized protein G2W53_031587 [Senna tora]|uniref:Uncharacterized protein n=1 Tax=Senna tora TaxID=362788 RepID=A0A834T910_9FABA|nr:uncharacterized protein G2W53_031587 [Senna tora]